MRRAESCEFAPRFKSYRPPAGTYKVKPTKFFLRLPGGAVVVYEVTRRPGAAIRQSRPSSWPPST